MDISQFCDNLSALFFCMDRYGIISALNDVPGTGRMYNRPCNRHALLCRERMRMEGEKMQKILVVEDDWEMNQGICYVLNENGYAAFPAHSIAEGKRVYEEQGVELVLLDVNLPDGEGFEFCGWIRGKSRVPVLFLTARDLEEDALKGYELGAEDYVTKPFSMKILLKKIDVILKRSSGTRGDVFDDGFLRIDFTRAKAEKNGQPCPVTPTEFRILREFISHKGQLLTYDVLLERLWDGGSQFVDRHALAVNMNRLRGKIEDKEHRYISNVYGMGYQWIGQ